VIALSENKKRPIVIDCANVACYYGHNIDALGDGRGPVEAYKYWKREGHNVKVFVWARKIYNRDQPEQVMANIEYFEKEIPIEDRIRIPPDADDDSYFISWAVKKDAILVSNDLLRDHHKRLNGEELKKFNSWIENGRCGYIFVDDEFIVDPNFQTQEISTVVLDSHLTSSKKSPKVKRRTYADNKRFVVHANKEIELMRRLSLSDKVLKASELASEIAILKEKRNEFNLNTNEKRGERNEINALVKEAVDEVAKLKESRNKHNLAAQELKKDRKLIDIDLKAAREKDGSKGKQSLSAESRALKRKQNIAHKAVNEEVAKANGFHSQMMLKSASIDNLREKANKIHKQMVASVEKADALHNEYMSVLYIKFGLEDLIKDEKKVNVIQEVNESEVQKPPYLSDVLRNREEKDISKELSDLLKETLVEYSSKTGRRMHIVDRAEPSYNLDEHNLEIISKEGWFLGIMRENKTLIIKSFIERYNLGSFNVKLKKDKNKPVSASSKKIILGEGFPVIEMFNRTAKGGFGYPIEPSEMANVLIVNSSFGREVLTKKQRLERIYEKLGGNKSRIRNILFRLQFTESDSAQESLDVLRLDFKEFKPNEKQYVWSSEEIEKIHLYFQRVQAYIERH